MTEQIETFEQKMSKAPEAVKKLFEREKEASRGIDTLHVTLDNALITAIKANCMVDGMVDFSLLTDRKENAETRKAVIESIDASIWNYVVEAMGKRINADEFGGRDDHYMTMLQESVTGISRAGLQRLMGEYNEKFYEAFRQISHDTEKGFTKGVAQGLMRNVADSVEEEDKQTLLDWCGAGKYVAPDVVKLEDAIRLAFQKFSQQSDITVDYMAKANKAALKPEYRALFN